MDWKSDYDAKRTSAAEAMNCVKSGDRVVFAHACGEPLDLVDALVARAGELEHVEIVHMVAIGKGEYCKPELARSFCHDSLFVGRSTQGAVAEGRGDYTPVFFSAIPDLFRAEYLPPDVMLAHLSPPDRHGFCSFGISVDYTKPATQAARTVVAQINPKMPRTHGDSFIHVSELDIIVDSDHDIIEPPPPQIGPVEEAIGRNIASLVDDGACLQLGIGGMFHVPHGIANTLMLPWVMEYNMLACSQFFREIGELMGENMEGLSDREGCEVTLQALRTLAEDLDVPQYLSEVGIPESAIPDLVKGAVTQARLWANNPRKFSAEDIEQVYRNMAVKPGTEPVPEKKAPAKKGAAKK